MCIFSNSSAAERRPLQKIYVQKLCDMYTGGSAATDDRRPAVVDATGAVQFGATPAPASNAPQEYAFEVEPGQVSIYPDTNGLRFYKIEFHSK